jgi:hypothetical protein
MAIGAASNNNIGQFAANIVTNAGNNSQRPAQQGGGFPIGNPGAMAYDPISGMPMTEYAFKRLASKNYNRTMEMFLEFFEAKEREKAEETLQEDEPAAE